MKQKTYILLFLFFLCHAIAHSQIAASQKNSCDTLLVNFSYTPATTIQKWFFGDKDTSTDENPKHFYKKPGKYIVKLLINNNTTDTIYFKDTIKIYESPRVSIEYRDTASNSNLVVALEAFVYNESKLLLPLHYSWAIDTFKFEGSGIVGYTFDKIGNYQVSVNVSDQSSCATIVHKTLILSEKAAIPNVFTPNSKEHNLFKFTLNGQTILNFQVFTRSGLLVYKTKTAAIEWDGKRSSGEDVTSGMYYYIIETEGASPPQTFKGFVYIYR
jgi:gliding motility-associated-like protein